MKVKATTNRKIIAVVKADCYSNGYYIAKHIEGLVDAFACSISIEAIKLREIGVVKPILILNYEKSQHNDVKKYDFIAGLSKIEDYDSDITFHIAVDTGMNRLGFKSCYDLNNMLSYIDTSNIKGIYSHIYSSDINTINNQLYRFYEYENILKNYTLDYVSHISSSSNLIASNKTFDYVRLGIGMYDGAISITSSIIMVKHIMPYESVGYNGEYISDIEQNIAICFGGYSDGIERVYKGNSVAINNKLYKIVGKISMDSFIIALGNDMYESGQKVSILDNENIFLEDIENNSKLSKYEILTGFKGRYNYVYFN